MIDGWVEEEQLHGLHEAKFESSAFLSVGKPKTFVYAASVDKKRHFTMYCG
jgi:hypothetical protein